MSNKILTYDEFKFRNNMYVWGILVSLLLSILIIYATPFKTDIKEGLALSIIFIWCCSVVVLVSLHRVDASKQSYIKYFDNKMSSIKHQINTEDIFKKTIKLVEKFNNE